MFYIVFFVFVHLVSFAESQVLFYEPKNEESSQINKTQDTNGYFVSHDTFMNVSIGDASATSGRNLEPFHRFNRERVNIESKITITDKEHKHTMYTHVQAGTNSNEDQSTLLYINEGYIELQSNTNAMIGAKVKFGLQGTASANLMVNSSTPMKYAKGVNGSWYRFVQLPVVNKEGGYNPTFMMHSTPMTSQGFSDASFLYSKSNYGEFNYVNPSPNWSASNVGAGFVTRRHNGVKFAYTFQPDMNTGNFGILGNRRFDRRGIAINAGRSMYMKNLSSIVLNYLDEWRGIIVNTSVFFETAGNSYDPTVVDIRRSDLKQYGIGVNLSYLGFTLGGSYSFAGQSFILQPNTKYLNSFSAANSEYAQVASITLIDDLYNLSANTNLLKYDNSYTYDVGLSYSFSRYQIGFSHLYTTFMNNIARAWIFSCSEGLKEMYGIKLTAFVELGFYNFQSANYFYHSDTTIMIARPEELRGYFGLFGIRAGL